MVMDKVVTALYVCKDKVGKDAWQMEIK
jgi:hypothetical protein